MNIQDRGLYPKNVFKFDHTNMKLASLAIFLCSLSGTLMSQDSLKIHSEKPASDSIKKQGTTNIPNSQPQLSYKSFILPSALLVYGLIGLGNNAVYHLDLQIQDQVWVQHPHQPVTIDNYLQYAPVASVYFLNAVGIKGEHNFIDRTGIYLLANVFLAVTVFPLKETTQQARPDESDNLSFPSGHSSEAFAGAEFMRIEYRNVSAWYGVAGYLMAAATGYLRIYNNNHYFSEVVAGAGIGIASAKLANWIYPKIKRIFYKDKPVHAMVMPSYSDRVFGFNFIYRF
jgi:membrane-associated phospholipid phosphatase